jgi:hypothetical protein
MDRVFSEAAPDIDNNIPGWLKSTPLLLTSSVSTRAPDWLYNSDMAHITMEELMYSAVLLMVGTLSIQASRPEGVKCLPTAVTNTVAAPGTYTLDGSNACTVGLLS